MQPSGVTELLFQQLNYRAQKQKVIASNIANIDTPDYKTKDLRFKNELDKAGETLQLKTTHSSHMNISMENEKSKVKMYEVKGLEEQNDGNNVNLDTQMSQQAQNTMMFNALQNSIKKDSTWFKSIIDSSAKN
ncbi:MAG: flagellar basal body rod protein FlgB [Campylobacterota bacterium]|nr:flagellar basal body rod protein FlgB [Campylobacterota bacterium]